MFKRLSSRLLTKYWLSRSYLAVCIIFLVVFLIGQIYDREGVWSKAVLVEVLWTMPSSLLVFFPLGPLLVVFWAFIVNILQGLHLTAEPFAGAGILIVGWVLATWFGYCQWFKFAPYLLLLTGL